MTITTVLLALSLVAASEVPNATPRAGCDVSVTFEIRKGEIDKESYVAIQRWLARGSFVSGFEDLADGGKGRKLCVHARSDDDIRSAFRAITLIFSQSYGGQAPVKIVDRLGGRYRVTGRTSTLISGPTPPRIPRDNGVGVRPEVPRDTAGNPSPRP